MREILFRGKRTDNGEWVQGDLSQHTTGKKFIRSKNKNALCSDEVIPETVGQYTGLTDKNGTKIFEGDIIVCHQAINGNFIDYHIEIGFVEMKHGAFGLHRKQGYYRPFKDWLEDYEYEIIGNDIRVDEVLLGAFDIINRQQAEIERLKKHNAEYKFCNLLGNVLVYSKNLEDYNDMRNGLISYGMKEFEKRLKEKASCCVATQNGQELYETKSYSISAIKLDNLVKEVVGESK